MLGPLMLEETLEAIVRFLTDADDGEDLAAARQAFEERTGPFEPSEPFFEHRIRAFLDFYLCTWVSADGSRPAARFAAHNAGETRDVALACLHAARSLYEVLDLEEGTLRLSDRIGGGRFRLEHDEVEHDRLRPGEVFDGRLLVLEDRIRLMPGLVFHPAEAHEPLAEVLAHAREEGTDRIAILDGLLRMRMRLDRFTNMRARHVYRFDALADRDILSAGWARRTSARSE